MNKEKNLNYGKDWYQANESGKCYQVINDKWEKCESETHHPDGTLWRDKFEQLSSQYDYKSSEYQKLNNKLNKIKWNVTEIINILNEEE